MKNVHLKKKKTKLKKKQEDKKKKNFRRSHQPRLAKLAGVPAQHLEAIGQERLLFLVELPISCQLSPC